MAITAKSTGEPRELAPAGNYFGVCVGVYDIGTQPGGKFGPKHKVILQFELHKKKGPVRDSKNNPFRISKFYTLSLSDKADLRKDVEKVLGRKFSEEEARDGYDITELIDRACRLSIAHEDGEDGRTYDNIAAFMPCDEDDPEFRPESDGVVYELDPSAPIPDEVPEWVKKKAMQSQEWEKAHGKAPQNGTGKGKDAPRPKAAKGPAPDDDDDDDDIPY